MKITRIICGLLTSAVLIAGQVSAISAGASDSIAHDPSRDVQTEGVGNPFNYGDRNTPANASIEEIRAINHEMTTQEVKYALYKEIDEHWDLLKVRLGQPDREKVYALFLGIGTRESTLGSGQFGADLETAYSQGFAESSAHAYGTLQTAVTAFANAGHDYMPEDNVPEMYQYDLTKENFYDAIISNHMGIRKILHFVEIAINNDGLTGYQVVRGALKGHNTGWVTYTPENEGYYKDYPDEIIALAAWYYEEGHLYDNQFTWTNAEAANKYRQGNPWDWWGGVEPSMAEITSGPPEPVEGDVNADGTFNVADVVAMQGFILNMNSLADWSVGDLDGSDDITVLDLALMRQLLVKQGLV